MTHMPPTTGPSEILLITRIRTLNKGNQALSAAWFALLERAFPGAPIRILERRPRHLLQYTLRVLAAAPDPVAAFDGIVADLARLAPGPDAIAPPPPPPAFLLDETISPPARFVRARQRLNLRGRLAAAGRYQAEFERRLAAFQRAALVVVNPAGEFFPREPQAALYHLFDAALAKELGRPTAIVNHTMDITDPTLRRIIPVLYRRLDLIGFRDAKSVGAFTAMGGDPGNVIVTPDLALTIEPPRGRARRACVVGLAINVPEATAGGYLETWAEVIQGLRTAGLEVVLVSNEMPADLPFYARLQARFPGLAVEGAGLDHERYAVLLSSFEVVISSRMHTAILAMTAGTPVVPVEGSSFKITGLFRELGFPEPVVRPGEGRWVDEIVRRTQHAHATHRETSAATLARIAIARDAILAGLLPPLRAAVAAPPARSVTP